MVGGAPGMVRPLHTRRGRVRAMPAEPPRRPHLAPVPVPAGLVPGLVAVREGPMVTAIVAGLMLMFFQVFHYMVDAGPAYYLSKVWPIVMAPFAILALWRGIAPHLRLYGALLFYLTGVSPVLSMLYFGNGFVDAMATTVKVWPFLYLFACLGLLMQLRPSPQTLHRVLLGLGVATLGLLWLLWLVVPHHMYSSDPAVSKLFLFDYERGYRIYMPMVFALLLTFYAVRRLLGGHGLLHLVWPLATLVSLVGIYKQRTTIAAAIVVVGLIVLARLPARLRWLAVGIGTFATAGAVAYRLGSDGLGSLGASLSVRQATALKVWEFLAPDQWQWLFGVGSITRLSNQTLGDVFGSDLFFLADVGWLGVVFEYGAIGAILILLVYLAAVRLTVRRPALPPGSPITDLRMAVGDVAVLTLIETLIYSPVFTPGIVATATALLLYLDRFALPGGSTKP